MSGIYFTCHWIFFLSISTSRECSVIPHIECCSLNAPMRPCVVQDNFFIRCVAELPLNDEALKHNRFTKISNVQ